MKKSKRYLMVLLHASLPLEKAFEVYLFSTAISPSSKKFYEMINKKYNLSNEVHWQVYNSDSAQGLKAFSNQLSTISKRIDNLVEVIRQQRFNKSQIPLPIEGE
jgi:hypothetical protein